MRHHSSRGFTLIEVLIVVVILSTLAAVAIPQFSDSQKDAREASLHRNIRTLRAGIEAYTLHHGTPPDGAKDLFQLTQPTNLAGEIGQAGPAYPYGPYLKTIPPQTFSMLTGVRLDSGSGTPKSLSSPGGGWIYRPATGQVWADHPDYVETY